MLFMASIIAVYWPLIRYPFIGDDWLYLHFYMRKGFFESFRRFILTYYSAISYCPLPSFLSLSLYSLFGLKPAILRAVTLAMVFMNGYFIVCITCRILNDNAPA